MPRREEPTSGDESTGFHIWRRPLHSIPTRIGFFVLGATLFASLAVTAVSVRSVDSFLREKIEGAFPHTLDRAIGELDQWYEERALEVRAISRDPVLTEHVDDLSRKTNAHDRDHARVEVEKRFDELLSGSPKIAAIFVIGRDGHGLVWSGEPVELSMGMREQIAEASISRVERTSEGPFQVASIPIGEGQVASLHALLFLNPLDEILSRSTSNISGRLSIVASDGNYLASSNRSVPGTRYPLPLPPAGAPIESRDFEGSEGEHLIGSAKRFGRFGWTLVVEEEYDRAFAPVVESIRRVLGINLAIVAVLALVAYRIAVGIVRPIEVLSEAARRISRGDSNVQIPHSISRDEVGLLTRAFYEMTNRLAANSREIDSAQRYVESVNKELQTRNDELHHANEVLAQLSITDGLTQLHNHRFFQDFLVKETKRADRTREPLGLILIDIDHFKVWNDRLGHAGGDEILRHMAEVMNTLLRGTDLLARYGGEEFALIAPGTDLEGATQLAEKMRSKIAETRFFIDPPSESERVTVSMGVAIYRGDRKQLFKEADQALYRAKSAGRDCVMLYEAD